MTFFHRYGFFGSWVIWAGWFVTLWHWWTVAFYWSLQLHPLCWNNLQFACREYSSPTLTRATSQIVFAQRLCTRQSKLWCVSSDTPTAEFHSRNPHMGWKFFGDHLLRRAGDLCVNHRFDFGVTTDEILDLWLTFCHRWSFGSLHLWVYPVNYILTTPVFRSLAHEVVSLMSSLTSVCVLRNDFLCLFILFPHCRFWVVKGRHAR